ncbi:MAG: hypothetical protein E7578_05290 [Ruminococcaceae bacterium]|nr:hypothetical protein [Oscillospiraceae bacterium]
MNNTKSSGNTSNSYVVMPELFELIFKSDELFRKSSAAFSYAEKSGYRMLFSARDILYKIYPNGPCECRTPDEYVERIEAIGAILQNIPDGVTVAFPGLISFPHEFSYESWNDDLTRRILSISNSLTLNYTYQPNFDVVSSILKNADDFNLSLNIIYDRSIPHEHINRITELWKKGKDITLCSTYGVSPPYNNGTGIYDGIFMIPGKTLLKKKALDLKGVDLPFDDISEFYPIIREKVVRIFKDEISLRFSHSSRLTPYYKREPLSDLLEPLGIFYPTCLGTDDEPRVNGILTGGAVDDAVVVTTDSFCCHNDEELAMILRSVTAACLTVNGKYPITLRPSFRNTTQISHKNELTYKLKSHARLSQIFRGSSILELSITNDFEFCDPDLLSSVISGFFRLGGTMIKFTQKGESL